MAAGAATSLATVPPAAVGFIAAIMAPLIACFVVAGDRLQLEMAAMLLLFAILMVLTARNGYLRFLDSVRMAVANTTLLRDIEAARATLLDAIESIGEAFVLFDRDDRMVLWNNKYLDVFAPIRDRIVRGMSFSEICELCWDHGLVQETGRSHEAWPKACPLPTFHLDEAMA